MQSEMDLQLVLPQLNDSNKSYTFASPRPQQFLLSYPIIKYIITNPSSGKAWKKLIQTCKYFFSKNPIYPVAWLNHINENEWKADEEIFDSTKNIAKLWIYDHIDVDSFSPSSLSSLIPKINKCNLRYLEIRDQHLAFKEYQCLTSSRDLKELLLICCSICHFDGTLVTFDRLFENAPKLEYFQMKFAENSSSMFQKDTCKKLAEVLPDLKELSDFNLWDITEAFDFASITDFILKNENLVINLRFYEDIPLSDAYKEILEKFIDKIIETPPKRTPYIEFPGFENSVYYQDYRKLYDSRK